MKQRVGAAVMLGRGLVRVVVVLFSATDGVLGIAVKVAETVFTAGAVVADSLARRELDGGGMKKLHSGPSSGNVIVSVTVITVSCADWVIDLPDSENAEKGSPVVVVTIGSADVGKQPTPIGEKSRQKGTLGGQHCGSGKKVLVQFGEL